MDAGAPGKQPYKETNNKNQDQCFHHDLLRKECTETADHPLHILRTRLPIAVDVLRQHFS